MNSCCTMHMILLLWTVVHISLATYPDDELDGPVLGTLHIGQTFDYFDGDRPNGYPMASAIRGTRVSGTVRRIKDVDMTAVPMQISNSTGDGMPRARPMKHFKPERSISRRKPEPRKVTLVKLKKSTTSFNKKSEKYVKKPVLKKFSTAAAAPVFVTRSYPTLVTFQPPIITTTKSQRQIIDEYFDNHAEP